MTSTASITDAKSTFLRQQVRLLSNPLQPSPYWAELTTTTTTSEPPTPLPEKTLTDLLAKLNSKLKSHNRLVFSIQSQRHVAEQIDTLYWNEVLAEGKTQDRDTVWVHRDADLTATSEIDALPGSLGEVVVGGVDEDVERRYAALRRRVEGLAIRRDEVRRKVEGYRQLRKLLGPFEDAKSNVQPNLVTKDGEVARELERMRVLIARVEGGVGEMESLGMDIDNATVQQPAEVSNQQKLNRVMDLG